MDNIHRFQRYDDILEEARVWVLTFNADSPATDADIQALREWAQRSPAHRQALKEAEAFWCEAELLSELAVPINRQQPARVRSAWGAICHRLSSIHRTAAVSLVLLLGISMTLLTPLLPLNGSVGNGIYSTAIGEQTTLLLRDNSQVQLDTDSQVRVAYQRGIRQIYLLRGKAHFNVAKHPQRPFEVYAGEGLVRAVGTAFSVYLTDNDVQVTVDEGRVDLARLTATSDTEQPPLPAQATDNNSVSIKQPTSNAPPDRPTGNNNVFLSLDKGQSARFNQTQQTLAQLTEKDLAQELAWRKGLLVFARDPLTQVVSEVSRYTQTKIEIADPALADLMLGGRFRVGELDALFEVLEIGFGVKINYINEHHVQLHLSSNQ